MSTDTKPKKNTENKTRSHDEPTTFPQYKGNLIQTFSRNLKKLFDLQVVVIT